MHQLYTVVADTRVMEDKPRNEVRALIVDPDKFVPDLTEQRVRMLYFELLMLFEDYDRENVIMYLASNYSVNKHFSFTALRGMYDDDIKIIMEETRDYLKEYLDGLKNHLLRFSAPMLFIATSTLGISILIALTRCFSARSMVPACMSSLPNVRCMSSNNSLSNVRPSDSS